MDKGQRAVVKSRAHNLEMNLWPIPLLSLFLVFTLESLLAQDHPRKAATWEEGRQVVLTKIQHKNKHLQLDSNIRFNKSRNGAPQTELIWRVQVEDEELRSKVGRITIWFPDDIQMFTDGKEISFTFNPSDGGIKSRTLTINPACPTGTYAFVIFSDIDGGEVGGFDRPVLKPNGKEWEQKGRQMVDGPHSHPDCLVGP